MKKEDDLLLPEPTLDNQIAAIKRELSRRSKIYPQWIKENPKAKRRINFEFFCIEAVLETLQKIQQSTIGETHVQN